MLLDNVDCFLLAKTRQPKGLSPFQEKELINSFLKNSELTKDVRISLSHRLGVTQREVKHFFQTQSKELSNVRLLKKTCNLRDYSALLNHCIYSINVIFLHIYIYIYIYLINYFLLTASTSKKASGWK